MLGLQIMDIITIILYFVVILGIGYYSARRIKNQEDYFLGGRRFGKFIQTFAAFGQGTSAENAVGMSVIVSRNGLAGIMQQLIGIFHLPIFWITSIWYRRLRTITLGDFFEERYKSKGLAAFYAIVSAFFFMIVIGLGFTAMSRTISAITEKPVTELTVQEKQEYKQALKLEQLEEKDYRLLTPVEKQQLEQLRVQEPRRQFSYLSETFIIWFVAFVVIIYAGFGGLEAAFLSDILQGMLILILSFLLLPAAYIEIQNVFNVEGISGVIATAKSNLSEATFHIWGSPAMTDFTWYYLLAIMITLLITTCVQANQLLATGSAKDEYTARSGFTTGIYMKRAATLFWGITALLLVILYKDHLSNPDYLWGIATRELLGSLGIGLVGLMIAALLGALMSTAEALMITASSLLTHNLVKPLFQNFTEKTYVRIGAGLGVVIVIGSVLIARQFDNVFQLIKLIWEFYIVIAAGFWLGMKWRRANRIGTWASALSTAFLFVILQVIIPLFPGVRTNDYLTKTIESQVLSKVYTARKVDVEQREQEIDLWNRLNRKGLAEGERPEPLIAGEKFQKIYKTTESSIFWVQGLKVNEEGQIYGSGMLSLELVFLDAIGFNLEKNPQALNETIRLIFRTLWPFLILMIVAVYTRKDEQDTLDKFYAKMKTPAIADKEEDARQVQLSMENPQRFDYKKMFPKSNWEFEKFEKQDWKGIIWTIAGGGLIFFLLYLISLIGK